MSSRNVINQDDIKKFIKKVSKRADESTQLWLKTVLRKHILNHHEQTSPYRVSANSPQWAKDAKERGDTLLKVEFDDTFVARIDHIVDYVNQYGGSDITRMSYQQASQQTDGWVRELAAKKQSEAQALEAAEGEEIVVDCGNGYNAVKLKNQAAFVREGKRMRHCIGDGGYYSQTRDGTCMGLSLRDETDHPHITFFVRNNKISEMRQSCNAIVREKYTKYILKIMNTLNLTYSGSYWAAGQDHIYKTPDGQQYQYDDIPDGAHIVGNISIIGAIITTFPDNLTIDGNLNLSYTTLDKFPNCNVKRGVYISGTEISELPEQEYYGNVDITDSKVIRLPENSVFHGNVITGRSGVEIPESTKVLGRVR